MAKRRNRPEADDRAELRRALTARDMAHQRLRRATGGAVVMAVALGGIFTALAAGSTHPKKKVAVARASVPARRRSRVAPLTVAPAAPLVAAHQAAPASAAPSSSAPDASAPVPSSAPPVVVSGGS